MENTFTLPSRGFSPIDRPVLLPVLLRSKMLPQSIPSVQAHQKARQNEQLKHLVETAEVECETWEEEEVERPARKRRVVGDGLPLQDARRATVGHRCLV